MDEIYIGTEKTYPIEIQSDGFSMDADTWSVRCQVGARSVTCGRVKIGDGWYFTLDTSGLRPGVVLCIVEYDVPDANFPNGLRHVVWKENLLKLKDYERL